MNLLKNILAYVCISGIFLLHPSFNEGDNFITKLQHAVYGNSFRVVINSEINPEELKVVWVASEQNELLIYAFGKEINKIPSISGKQKLVVYYQNKVVGKVEQNKSTPFQAHKYSLNVSSKNNAIFFKGEISGPSGVKSPATTTLPFASL